MNEEILRQGRILLVDDDVSCLCLLESLLGRLCFKQIHKLSDPTRILAEFECFNPDLVITDLDMPKLDGFELIGRLRQHLPPEAGLPILMLTGSGDPKVKRRALLAGASDILLKPFDSSELQMRIRNLLLTRFQHVEIQGQNRVLEQKVGQRTKALESALTELKDSQRQVVQQERFRAFGEMAGGVVHDFNNALMSVVGYSDLLLQDEALMSDPAVVRLYLETMNTAGRDASHVVSRLRDFYRPREESDVFGAVEMNRVIEEVVPLTRPKWHDHALQSGRVITLELELEKVPPVFGNGAELREVITNLIFNAVDAMPVGGKITLRSMAVGDSIIVEIADTGTGMSEEVRERCMEPFFSTKAEHGTGLGLSMSFGIIRRHEGTLDIETAPGRGTTFRILLPCRSEEAATPEETPVILACVRRVLVVDDDLVSLEVISHYLRADGHRVVTAKDGFEALKCFGQEAFDAVITDQGMPGMSGFQLADEIRQIAPGKPVILVTGFALQPEQNPASIHGILKKPVGRAKLRSALASAIAECSEASHHESPPAYAQMRIG